MGNLVVSRVPVYLAAGAGHGTLPQNVPTRGKRPLPAWRPAHQYAHRECRRECRCTRNAGLEAGAPWEPAGLEAGAPVRGRRGRHKKKRASHVLSSWDARATGPCGREGRPQAHLVAAAIGGDGRGCARAVPRTARCAARASHVPGPAAPASGSPRCRRRRGPVGPGRPLPATRLARRASG